jgi:two-component system NtrC family sensor kinase
MLPYGTGLAYLALPWSILRLRLGMGVYDVILCDLRMPGVDGLQLYRELERRDASALRRLVLCTGDVLGHEAQEFLETVAAPTLSKPFVAAEVRRVVRHIAEAVPAVRRA